MGLEAEERETLISWCDNEPDNNLFIHTTQRPMMNRLLKNPLFEKTREIIVEGELVGVEGRLPRKALSIRKKFRVMSEKQKTDIRNRLSNYRNGTVKP